MATAEVHITLKPALLDAQGATVLKALRQLGHAHVQNVRVGKHIEVEFDEALSGAALQSELELMCRQLLANPVIEDYSITVGGAPIGGGAAGGASTPTTETASISPLAAASDAHTTATQQIVTTESDLVPHPRPLSSSGSATPDVQPAQVSAPRISSPQQVAPAPVSPTSAQTAPTPLAMPGVAAAPEGVAPSSLPDPFALSFADYQAMSAEDKLALQGRAWQMHGARIAQELNTRRAAWVLCVGGNFVDAGPDLDTYPSDQRLASLSAANDLVPWVFTRPPAQQ